MIDSAPVSDKNKQCQRCGDWKGKTFWWHTVIALDGLRKHVCEDCRHQIDAIDVDTSDWPLDDETPSEGAEFRPASEVATGP